MDSATNDLRKLFDRLREDTQRFKMAEDVQHRETQDEDTEGRDTATAVTAAPVKEDEVYELHTSSAEKPESDLDLDLDLELDSYDDMFDAPLHDELEQKAS